MLTDFNYLHESAPSNKPPRWTHVSLIVWRNNWKACTIFLEMFWFASSICCRIAEDIVLCISGSTTKSHEKVFEDSETMLH